MPTREGNPVSAQLSIFDNDAEPSRVSGTCPDCGQPVALRPPMNGAPYPALTRSHDALDRGTRGQTFPCSGANLVPDEWRAWLTADPGREAAYHAEFEAWLQKVGVAQ
jgi:hypothetical protein